MKIENRMQTIANRINTPTSSSLRALPTSSLAENFQDDKSVSGGGEDGVYGGDRMSILEGISRSK